MSEVGEILRTARQNKHLTLPEVADATHIKMQFLEALEDGAYSQLPGQAYVTGFLRNYARFLDLHPDDLIQEYYSARPMPVPTVKPATRVLANGHERQNRRRVLAALMVVALMFVGGYAIKLYNDTSAHAQPQLNVTPANLGGGVTVHPPSKPVAKIIHLSLMAVAPVWVDVSVDGKQAFNGMLRTQTGIKKFVGHRHIYVSSYNGSRVDVTLNGRPLGAMATKPGQTVCEATRTGWQHIL